MRRIRHALASLLALSSLAVAQDPWDDAIDQRLSEVSDGSVAWYRLSLARVGRMADRDLAKAAQEAERLWQQARESGPAGARQAAASWVALTLTMAEGPQAAALWRDRAELPPDAADAWLQAGVGELLYATSTTVWLDRWRELHDNFGIWMGDEPTGTQPDDLTLRVLPTGDDLTTKRAALGRHHSQTGPVAEALGEAQYREWIAEECFRRPTAADLVTTGATATEWPTVTRALAGAS